MKEHLSILRKSNLLSSLTDENILSALKCLNARKKVFSKGEVIFLEGERAGHIGIILNGEIQAQKVDYKGNANIISKLYSSDLIAAVAAYSSSKYLPFDIVCADDSEVLFLDYSGLICPCCKACAHHTQLIENMLMVIADKNIQLTEKMDILLKRSIRDKVLSFLFSQSKKSKSEKFSIFMSRNQMAEFLSVNRSALSKVLCKMRDEGILEFNGNIFRFTNKQQC